jgi:outer membrane protein
MQRHEARRIMNFVKQHIYLSPSFITAKAWTRFNIWFLGEVNCYSFVGLFFFWGPAFAGMTELWKKLGRQGYSLVISIILSIVLNVSCFAEQAKPSVYVVLDIDVVVNQSIAYKEFKERWGRVSDKFQKEIEFYESQLVELEKRVTMSISKSTSNKSDIISNKQKIGTYEVKVQNLLRARKEALEGASDKATEILRTNIDNLVSNYAKQNGTSIIFTKSQVIYFAESVDITDIILNKLNAKLRRLEVNL